MKIIDNRDPNRKKFNFGNLDFSIKDMKKGDMMKDPSLYNVHNDHKEGLDTEIISDFDGLDGKQ